MFGLQLGQLVSWRTPQAPVLSRRHARMTTFCTSTNRGGTIRLVITLRVGVAVCAAVVALASAAWAASADPASADPSYSSQEQTLLDQLMKMCNDMPNEPTIHARALKALELIQDDARPLGPNETAITVEKFVRNSIPDGAGPQKCVDLMGIYAQMRSTGAITTP